MKMTNTLIWNTKSLQLPNINSNLLAVISLILIFTVLCTIIYPAMEANASGSDCTEILQRVALWTSLTAVSAVGIKLLIEAWKSAMLSGNIWAIIGVTAALAVAGLIAVGFGMLTIHDSQKYLDCLENQENPNSAGGCDSGGNVG